jgi:hypothetical protein
VQGQLTAPAGEGDHWLVLLGRDQVGRLSEPRWYLVRVDGTGPEITFELPQPQQEQAGVLWLAPGAEVVIRAADSVAGVGSLEAGVDADRTDGTEGDPGGSNAAVSDATDPALAVLTLPAKTGRLNLSATAEDRVGNLARAMRPNLAVDATAPRIEIAVRGASVDHPEGVVLGPGSGLELRIVEEESGTGESRRWLDGVEVDSDLAWCCGGSAGRHTMRAEVLDEVGNVGAAERTVQLDVTGPALRLEVRSRARIGEGEAAVFASPASFTVHAEDSLAGVEQLLWSRGGGALEPWLGAAQELVRTSTVEVQARDLVGNSSVLTQQILIDNAPPVLAARVAQREILPGELIVVGVNELVEVVATDSVAGVDTVLVSSSLRGERSGGNYVPRTELRFELWGEYVVEARATDRLGQESRATWRVSVRRRGVQP